MDKNNLCDVLTELCEYCISDELTLPTLQEKLKWLDGWTPHYVKAKYSLRPFFHNVCLSKSVTLEIVEYILDKFPDAASVLSKDSHGYYNNEQGGSSDTEHTYPLHLACYNQYCSTAIIKLIMEKYPKAIEDDAIVNSLFTCGDYGEVAYGFPLHYYVARKTNVDIDTIKVLLDAYPEAADAGANDGFTPLHAMVNNPNENINNLLHIIKYLIEVEPSLIRQVDNFQRTPLLTACFNKSITLEVVQLLYHAYPEAIRIPESVGWLPIHELCSNKLGDLASIGILRFMLNIDPTLAREGNGDNYLPIHFAVEGKSTNFCKVLIDAYPESLKAEASHGLPIHLVVSHYNERADAVDTIQYMLDLYPESINARNDMYGYLPIHKAAQGKRTDIVELLLKYDPDAATKVTNNEHRKLPLHLACGCNKEQRDVVVVKTLYDAFPQAINLRNNNGQGRVPLEYAREKRYEAAVNFLETQNIYAQKAKDSSAMHTLDHNGWLPLHRALKDNVPLGSIQLLVEGNTSALMTADSRMAFPLHLACEFSSVKVVKYLVEEWFGIPMGQLDTNKDSVLHYACRGGNLGVVKYLIDKHASLVASVVVNEKGELPIHLLCEKGKDKFDSEDRTDTEYIETIWLMLLANPEAVMTMGD